MFTGIVEETGAVLNVSDEADGRRVTIATGFADLSEGQSIAVDGACLTVEAWSDRAEAEDGVSDERPTRDRRFTVFLASETLDRTTLGGLEAGDPVNLERAMPADGRFDGHVVQGHVDATAEVSAIESVGEDWRYEFSLPADCAPYVVEKGSIAVDGISLTVAERTEETFAVAVVPTTYEETTLSAAAVGDRVNLEVDVLAKYVERAVQGSSSLRSD